MSTDTNVPETEHDVIIIGSGFGGSMTAHTLVNAGLDVLILERGEHVERGPHNWEPEGSLDLTRHYTFESPYRVESGGHSDTMGAYACVGGPSVFYGTVSLRFREEDFQPDPGIVGDAGARWPFGYTELEPYYTRAERILDIAGVAGRDPTEPERSAPYPQSPRELSVVSQMIGAGARSLGLEPFPLPLAINYRSDGDRTPCIACDTCDTFACAIGAKNDLATRVLPKLLGRGLRLQAETVATRLVTDGERVVAVESWGKSTGARQRHTARAFVVACGALGSPHLLLASGLEERNPAGDLVGRYLMRHCAGIVFGFFPGLGKDATEFHKQLGIHDFYFGGDDRSGGKLGGLQQIQTPPVGLVREWLPSLVARVAIPITRRATGLLTLAEDQPRYENRVRVDPENRDRFGLPQLVITHRHTRRDRAARRTLARYARRILKSAGAWLTYMHRIQTFSHAVGTVRMGEDPENAPLDPDCRFRGLENLYVVDGSCLPTSAGVNPSLTISANALRAAGRIARTLGAEDADARVTT